MVRFGWNSAAWCKINADCGDIIKIKTGSRIPICRTFVFQNGSSYISATNWDVLTKFGMLIDFNLPNTMASTSRKPEVILNGGGRHFEKSIWRHIYAVGGPIWTKFGSLMQNSMQITAKWWRTKPEVEFKYAFFSVQNCGTGTLYAQLAGRLYGYIYAAENGRQSLLKTIN